MRYCPQARGSRRRRVAAPRAPWRGTWAFHTVRGDSLAARRHSDKCFDVHRVRRQHHRAVKIRAALSGLRPEAASQRGGLREVTAISGSWQGRVRPLVMVDEAAPVQCNPQTERLSPGSPGAYALQRAPTLQAFLRSNKPALSRRFIAEVSARADNKGKADKGQLLAHRIQGRRQCGPRGVDRVNKKTRGDAERLRNRGGVQRAVGRGKVRHWEPHRMSKSGHRLRERGPLVYLALRTSEHGLDFIRAVRFGERRAPRRVRQKWLRFRHISSSKSVLSTAMRQNRIPLHQVRLERREHRLQLSRRKPPAANTSRSSPFSAVSIRR